MLLFIIIDVFRCLTELPGRAHAAELGNVVPEEPLLFLKPTTSYLQEGGHIVVSIP